MLNRIDSENPALALDEKIHAVAKKVQWSKPDHIVIKQGGFHRVNNFME